MGLVSDLWPLLRSLQGFALVIIPPLLRYLHGQYLAIKTAKRTIKPLTNGQKIAIITLVTWAVIQLIILLRQPENIFKLTDSRIQTPGEVIATRLRSFRRTSELIQSDQLLTSRLASQEGRLLYALFGPDAFSNCIWCKTESWNTFFLYLFPILALPYLINAFVAVIVTTRSIAGRAGQSWRFTAICVVLGLFVIDLMQLYSFKPASNKSAKTLKEIDWFYWRLRAIRWGLLSGANVAFSGVLYLSCTGRMWPVAEPVIVRLRAVEKQLDQSIGRLRASILLRSVVAKNDQTRGKYDDFWKRTAKVEQLLNEHEEVKQARENGLTRLNVNQINLEADKFVEAFTSDY